MGYQLKKTPCISPRETWWRTNVEEHPDGQVLLGFKIYDEDDNNDNNDDPQWWRTPRRSGKFQHRFWRSSLRARLKKDAIIIQPHPPSFVKLWFQVSYDLVKRCLCFAFYPTLVWFAEILSTKDIHRDIKILSTKDIRRICNIEIESTFVSCPFYRLLVAWLNNPFSYC